MRTEESVYSVYIGGLAGLALAIVLAGAIEDTRAQTFWERIPGAKPEASLVVSPRLGLHPLIVRARLRIDNPGPELYCPKITWTFGQGRVSSSESDCDPWDELDEADRGKPVLDSKIQRYGPGTYTIKVRVEQGKKSLELEETIEVLGGTE